VSGGLVSGAAVRDQTPDADDQGMVVRPIGTVTVLDPAALGASSTVAASLIAVTLLAANTSRLGFTIYNTSLADTLYVLVGAGVVSATSFTVALVPGAYYESPVRYVGGVTGVWDPAATGDALITEFTPVP